MNERCENCEGRLDRPGLYGCDSESHPAPTPSQRVVTGLLEELSGRGLLDSAMLDDGLAWRVRDVLAKRVDLQLAAIYSERKYRPAPVHAEMN